MDLPAVVMLDDVRIGGDEGIVMAGPCSAENEEQVFATAAAVKKAGAKVFRGGAFKPRSSPYSFQGLGAEVGRRQVWGQSRGQTPHLVHGTRGAVHRAHVESVAEEVGQVASPAAAGVEQAHPRGQASLEKLVE